MLEAMACGTPVAAYPVDGPLEVVGEQVAHPGGVLHADLQQACLQALQLPRSQARERAERFDWSHAASSFEANLVSIRGHSLAAPSSRCTTA
jgi:glycosyltransferase involved in cell wall biosynthesis